MNFKITKAEHGQFLYLGRRGERFVRCVQFDLSHWMETYGSGRVELSVQRSGENSPYPVALELSGSIASWILSDVDTAVAGNGKCRLTYFVGDGIAHSRTWTTIVENTLADPVGDPPEREKAWVDEVLAVGAASKQNAEDAAKSAALAKQAANDVKPELAAYLNAAERAAEASAASAQRAKESEDKAPTAVVSKSGNVTTISITDKNGSSTVEIPDSSVTGQSISEALGYIPADAKKVSDLEIALGESEHRLSESFNNILDDVNELRELNYLHNMCNNDIQFKSGFINWQTGSVSPHNTYKYTGYIPVKKGTLCLVRNTLYSHFAFYSSRSEDSFVQNTVGNDIRSFDGGQVRSFSDNLNSSYFISPIDGFVRFTTQKDAVILVYSKSITDDTSSVNVNDLVVYPQYVIRGMEKLDELSNGADGTVTGDIIYSLGDLYKRFVNHNLADPNFFTIGSFWRNTATDPTANPSFFYTGKIYVEEGDIVYVTSASGARFFTAFDHNDSVLISKGGETSPYTVQSGVAYIRISGYVNDAKKFMVNTGSEALPYSPFFNFNHTVNAGFNIYAHESEEIIYNKLLVAKAIGGCYVKFEKGTYEFDSIFDTMKTKYGLTTAYELPLGGGCIYDLGGSTIIGRYSGSDNNVKTNASVFGTNRTPQSFILKNGKIIAYDLVYCLHIEGSGLEGENDIVVENVDMEYVTITSTSSLRKCIGCGSGKNGTTYVKGCILKSDYDYEFSYHGSDNGEYTLVKIESCVFGHSFRTGQAGANESFTLVFTSNVCNELPNGNDWEIYSAGNNVTSN